MVCEQARLQTLAHTYTLVPSVVCGGQCTPFPSRQLSVVRQSVSAQPASVLLLCNPHRACVRAGASKSMPSKSPFVDLTRSHSLVRNPCSSPLSVPAHLHGHGEKAEFEPVSFP